MEILIKYKPVSEFPLLKKYKKRFNVPEGIAYPYGDTIYTDDPLPDYLVVHESEHLRQQQVYGLKKWIKRYFKEDEFRLDMEMLAYKKQLESVKDRNLRNEYHLIAARELSGDLYGNLIKFNEAMLCLKSQSESQPTEQLMQRPPCRL